ncbi:MAG: hypothetical protein ACI835_004359 [Planctomycetota bacterium]|jgi:hypothetical protein
MEISPFMGVSENAQKFWGQPGQEVHLIARDDRRIF